MKCVFCDNELVKRKQTIERRIEKQLVYINNVPVDLCTSCGEVYIDDDVVSKMNNILKVLSATKVMPTLIDYDTFDEQCSTDSANSPANEDFNNLMNAMG